MSCIGGFVFSFVTLADVLGYQRNSRYFVGFK